MTTSRLGYTLIAIVLSFSCTRKESIDSSSDESILTDLILEDHELEYSKKADLNFDGIEDYILVCHHRNEISDTKTRFPRPVLVYFGTANGKFVLKGRNDIVRLDASYETPNNKYTLDGITVKDNYFTIENSYGSSLTFTKVYYTFKVVNNEIYFHRVDNSTFEVIDSDKGPELNNKNTIFGKDIGNPTFANYK